MQKKSVTGSAPESAPEKGTAGEVVDKMSGCACEPRATAGKDAEVAAEAAGSLDKMSGWPKGGIASAGKIVDNMSWCVRARLKWCPRS